MRSPVDRRTLFVISIILIVGGLLVSLSAGASAQNSTNTFLDLLKPSIGKEILVGSPSSQYPRPVILKEVRHDYIVIETDRKTIEAILLYSMNSITLGEPLQLHLNR